MSHNTNSNFPPQFARVNEAPNDEPLGRTLRSFERIALSRLLAQPCLLRGQRDEGNPLGALINSEERVAPCCVHSITASPIHPLGRPRRQQKKLAVQLPTHTALISRLRGHAKRKG